MFQLNNKDCCQILCFLVNCILTVSASCGLQLAVPLWMLSYGLWGICWCSQLWVNRNHSKSEICQRQLLSMGILEPLALRTCLDACLLFALEYFKHSSQLKTNFSDCSLIPSQYTISLHQSLHFPRPKWPLCIDINICLCLLLGITIWVPFSTSPSSVISSSQNIQYACISGGTSFMELGHPFVIVYFNRMSSSSSWVAVWSWFNVSILALSWLVIFYTCSFGNLMLSFWFPSLNKQSANWFVGPGIWHTVKWYGNVLMRILCNHGVACFKLFESLLLVVSDPSLRWSGYHIGNGGIFPWPCHCQGF